MRPSDLVGMTRCETRAGFKTIRLDTKTLTRIRTQAHEKGLCPTTLVGMWILERLKEIEH